MDTIANKSDASREDLNKIPQGHTPAFPQGPTEIGGSEGMTLLDYFAASAANGLCGNSGGPIQANGMSGWGLVNCTAEHIAGMAYGIAGAMIARREEIDRLAAAAPELLSALKQINEFFRHNNPVYPSALAAADQTSDPDVTFKALVASLIEKAEGRVS